MPDSFEKQFEILTGNKPFPWQQALYTHFCKGVFKSSCNIPTGLGKTSVLAIWLIAQSQFPDLIPRRLVYVVNRRTVVDQTTTEAENLKKNAKAAGCLEPAISTLRGQFADNREWSADPSRPAIICGTVDMIGSRLLFNGYGIGFKSKPLHAGFLGQDVLLVHDEAHLEPAFQELLISIEKEQKRSNEFQKFRVMELTATSRGKDFFTLTENDLKVDEVKKRINAKKTIFFHEESDPKKLADHIAEQALKHKDSKKCILIYVRTLKDVESIFTKLADRKNGVGEDQVRALNGKMRGIERDKFTKIDPVFIRFLPEKSRNQEVTPTQGTVYLVCTSAGEVGIDISADHMVCDLSPFDSMAQRFGRVNRYGNCIDTRIDIVHPKEFGKRDKKTNELKPDAIDSSREKTLVLLKNLPTTDGEGFDASPSALSNLPAEARQVAFTPLPTILPTADILFDAWAMTSIRENMPGRPDVGPYLHGLADDLPQTSIAWRSELDLVAHIPNPARALQAIFTKHRIRPHETVTVNSFSIIEFFKEITKKRDALRSTRIAILFSRKLVLTSIGDLIDKPELLNADPTLIFPASFGYLHRNGTLDADAIPSETSNDKLPQSLDVADHEGYEPDLKTLHTRLRVIIKRIPEGWLVEPLIPGTKIGTSPDRIFETSTKLVNALRDNRYQVRLVQPFEFDKDGDVAKSFVALSGLKKALEKEEQLLEEHIQKVCEWAKIIADKLNLSEPLRESLLFAAKWHDEGKKAAVWQRYIGGPNSNGQPLGKSTKWCDPKKLSGYRHEFGSLLRIKKYKDSELPKNLDSQELGLHLIAAHHGHARPHFTNSFDKEFSSIECEKIHIETLRRFARLQTKYGRWGLAYLESLLRAADVAASAGLETDDEIEEAIGVDA